jgi:4-amino-4-deoxy-L-arabinose transferase-like glycosyltransferase
MRSAEPSLKERPFWLLTLSLIFILIISQLIQDGAFNDGMLYVSVAKNMANGLGTFWQPYFGNIARSPFHDQPPLYFGILSIFFKLFGQSMYTERIFSLFTFVITMRYIQKIWKIIFRNDTIIANKSWLPVLLWIIIPICFWTYINFVEEILMGVFTIISVYYILKFLTSDKNPILYISIAAFSLFLASLTKGFQGLYPMAAIVIYWTIEPAKISLKKCLLYTSILFLVPLLIYSVLLLNPDVYSAYKSYFQLRLVTAFNGSIATTNSRLHLLLDLFCQLLPPLLLSATILLVSKIKKTIVLNKTTLKTALWFSLIGLSGTIPLMATLEQREFYIATSLPFFVIPIAILIVPSFSALQSGMNFESRTYKTFQNICWTLLVGSIVFTATRFGKFHRDKEELSDIYKFCTIIPSGSYINVTEDLWYEYSVHTYFNRYNSTVLVHQKDKLFPFCMAPKSTILDSTFLSRYLKVSLTTNMFDLYKLKTYR